MKLICILIVVAVVQVSARVYAQKINLTVQKAQIEDVLALLQKQSGYDFLYSEKLMAKASPVSISLKEVTISQALDEVFNNQPLTYVVNKKTITIKARVGVVAVVNSIITGVVTDDKGEPLPGVSIQLKGSKTGAITDLHGAYSLSVPDNSKGVLVFSFIGFATREVSLNGTNAINLTMQPDNQKLLDVVVTGYTSQSRHSLTSAIVSVKGEEMTKRVATDATSLLQGQLPGLSVVQNSGEPGNERIQLRIRGIGTFSSAGTDPLVIVDGLPGSLSAINPNDIETATVLKDAAAATIYGSRGANGVVVITTKKGKAGSFTLTYNYSIGFSTATRLPKLITNSAQYMQLLNEAEANSGSTPIYTQAQIDLYANATDRVKYPNHDWVKDMFSTAVVQNHYLNLGGGNESTTYSLGLGFTDQPGTMNGFTYKKYTLDLGLSSKVNKRVTLGTNFQLRYGDKNNPYDNASDLYASTLTQSPLYPAQTADGLWITKAYDKELGNKNPILTSSIKNQNPDYYGQGNISLDVAIVNGLKWENRAGLSIMVDKSKIFRPVIPEYLYSDLSFYRNADVGTPGLSVNENDDIHSTVYSQLNFHKTFGKHDITILGGVQQETDNTSLVDAFRINYPTNQLSELNAGSANGQTNDGTSSQYVIHSLYGSANYSFDDKYLLGASVRYDGSSRLPANSRWKLYESFSGGWRVSQENFLKDVEWINDLKIRGSWGRIGNQNIGNYPYQPALLQSNYPFAGNIANGFQANQLVDPNLTWETARMTNIGFDITALKNKLTFTFDWFSKYTYNILRSSQVPLALGVLAPTVNNGAVSNKGLEFSLHYQDHPSQKFSYYATANFQLYRNKIAAYGAPQTAGPDNQIINQNGYPVNSFYLYTMDGIFQNQAEIANSPNQSSLGGPPTPGDIKYKDVNGDGKVDANDRSIFPGQYPSFEYSYTMGATYGNFDASVQLYGSYGNKLYLYKWGVDPFQQGTAPTTDWLNRWTPENPSTTMPKIYVSGSYPKISSVQSTFHLYNASFMRIKNLQVGYTFPKLMVPGVRSIRVFASADNLALFTPLKLGADPERQDIANRANPFYGFVSYPQNRTYSFGVTAQF